MPLMRSPMCYVGGKYRLLPQLLPLFPKGISSFADLFCGGMDVSLNAPCQRVYCNDVVKPLVAAYEWVASSAWETVDESLSALKERYGLVLFGDKAGYEALRRDYNASQNPPMTLMLAFCCFNHDINYNRKGKFNSPCGLDRGCYGAETRLRLRRMWEKLHSGGFIFSAGKFDAFDFGQLGKDAFVYCDPPYLISDARFNALWNKEREAALYSLLERLDAAGVEWGVSNVLENKGLENGILKAFAKRYNCLRLDMDYSNCSYRRKAKDGGDAIEVYVCNYECEKPQMELDF